MFFVFVAIFTVALHKYLNVFVAPPSFTAHPLTPLSLSEWDMFTLNCTITGSVDMINITWHRSNGSALPEGHTIDTMTDQMMVSLGYCVLYKCMTY